MSIFAAAKGKKAKAVKAVTESCVPTALRRQSPYLQEPVFNAYRSESALMQMCIRDRVVFKGVPVEILVCNYILYFFHCGNFCDTIAR